MISFYCGVIENEAVSAFYPVNILTIEELIGNVYEVATVNTLTETKRSIEYEYSLLNQYNLTENSISSDAVDWRTAIFNALGVDPNNFSTSDIAGKDVNFFASNSVDTILPFKIHIGDDISSTTRFSIYLMDTSGHGITMASYLYNTYTPLSGHSYDGMYVAMKPGTDYNNFVDLCNDALNEQKTLYSGSQYLAALCFRTELAPISFYCLHNYNDTTYNLLPSLYSLGADNFFWYYRNLQVAENWYTLLVGTMPFTGPVLALAEETNGFTYIELSYPVMYTNRGYVADIGIETDIEDTDDQYLLDAMYGYHSVVVGTDLEQLFNSTNGTIYLKNNGYISRVNNRTYIISNDNGAIQFTYSRSLDTFYRVGSNYITLSPDFITTNANNWYKLIPDDISAFSVSNCPFMITTLAMRGFDSTYFSGFGTQMFAGTVTECNITVLGWAFNMWHGSVSNNEYYDRLYAASITKEFWTDLLANLGDYEGSSVAPNPTTGDIGTIDSIGGSYSSASGGGGSYTDETDDISGISSSITGASGLTQLFKIYTVSTNAINAIGAWANSLFTDLLGIVESIISLKQLRVPNNASLSGSTVNLEVAGQEIAVHGTTYQGTILDKQFYYANLGSIYIEEYYGSFLDYNGYTDIEIYLPFAGTYKLDTNTVMNSTLSIKCGVDVVSGTVVYDLTIENDTVNSVIYTFTGNCANDLPITYTDYSGKISGFVNTAVGIAGMALAPASMGASLGASAVALGASGALNAMQGPNHGSKGSAGKNAGYAMPAYPYLIITRPVRELPENYGSIVGFPSQIGGNVGSFDGFTVLSDVKLTGITGATDDEIDEIETLLKSGVYV